MGKTVAKDVLHVTPDLDRTVEVIYYSTDKGDVYKCFYEDRLAFITYDVVLADVLYSAYIKLLKQEFRRFREGQGE